ncbi:MAG: DUF6745 domain-containing protein [Synechococcus sp.]
MTNPLHRLTLEQEAMLFGSRDRWKRAGLQTTSPVGRQAQERSRDLAREAVRMAYAISGLSDPDIVFCSSPLHGFDTVMDWLQDISGSMENSRLGLPVGELLQSKILLDQLEAIGEHLEEDSIRSLSVSPQGQLGTLVGNQLGSEFSARHFVGLTLAIGGGQNLEQEFPWAKPLTRMLLQFADSPKSFFELPIEIHAFDADGQPTDDLGDLWGVVLGSEQGLSLFNCLTPELWSGYCGYLDFFYSLLKFDCPEKHWYVLKSLVKRCGWFLPFKNVAIVCDRPTHLLLDSDNRIHASGEPAIQYTDGFRVYANHGTRID